MDANWMQNLRTDSHKITLFTWLQDLEKWNKLQTGRRPQVADIFLVTHAWYGVRWVWLQWATHVLELLVQRRVIEDAVRVSDLLGHRLCLWVHENKTNYGTDWRLSFFFMCSLTHVTRLNTNRRKSMFGKKISSLVLMLTEVQFLSALPSHVPPVVSVGPSSQPLWAGRKKHPWYCESSQEPARKPILFYLWYQLLTKQQRYHHHRCQSHKKQCGQQRWALSRQWWRNQRSRKRKTR